MLGHLRRKHRAKVTQADGEKMGFLKNESLKSLYLLIFPHMVRPIVAWCVPLWRVHGGAIDRSHSLDMVRDAVKILNFEKI